MGYSFMLLAKIASRVISSLVRMALFTINHKKNDFWRDLPFPYILKSGTTLRTGKSIVCRVNIKTFHSSQISKIQYLELYQAVLLRYPQQLNSIHYSAQLTTIYKIECSRPTSIINELMDRNILLFTKFE